MLSLETLQRNSAAAQLAQCQQRLAAAVARKEVEIVKVRDAGRRRRLDDEAREARGPVAEALIEEARSAMVVVHGELRIKEDLRVAEQRRLFAVREEEVQRMVATGHKKEQRKSMTLSLPDEDEGQRMVASGQENSSSEVKVARKEK